MNKHIEELIALGIDPIKAKELTYKIANTAFKAGEENHYDDIYGYSLDKTFDEWFNDTLTL